MSLENIRWAAEPVARSVRILVPDQALAGGKDEAAEACAPVAPGPAAQHPAPWFCFRGIEEIAVTPQESLGEDLEVFEAVLVPRIGGQKRADAARGQSLVEFAHVLAEVREQRQRVELVLAQRETAQARERDEHDHQADQEQRQVVDFRQSAA